MTRPRGEARTWARIAVLGLTLALAGLAAIGIGASPASAAPGPVAPDFSGHIIGGADVSIDTYHGKPLVLLFWGSW
jgi:hypothetical protein